MLIHGIPQHIRSDNGAEMTAKVIRSWLGQLGTTLHRTWQSVGERLLRVVQRQAS